MIDRYNRNIDKLVISLKKDSNLSNEDIKFVVSVLSELGVTIVDLEVEDSTDELKIYDLIQFFKSKCNIEYIGIIPDGFGLKDKLNKLKSLGLTDIGIRLESLKQYKYKKLNHNININEVLETMDKSINLRLNTRIICTVINDFNVDEILDFINLTKLLPVEISFSELVPKPDCIKFFNKAYVNMNDIVDYIKDLDKLDYKGQRYKYYKLKDSRGIISIDTHNDSSVCTMCNEIILDEFGFLKPCIHSNLGINIEKYINKPLLFKEAIRQNIYKKNNKNLSFN